MLYGNSQKQKGDWKKNCYFWPESIIKCTIITPLQCCITFLQTMTKKSRSNIHWLQSISDSPVKNKSHLSKKEVSFLSWIWPQGKADLRVFGPQPDTSRNCMTMVVGPVWCMVCLFASQHFYYRVTQIHQNIFFLTCITKYTGKWWFWQFGIQKITF